MLIGNDTMGKVAQFHCTQPCNNCPYRKDAPLRHWSVEEYKDLLEKEQDVMGAVYGCHKNNGSVCVDWLMKQDDAGLPSIRLRLALSKEGVTREYMDKLHSPSPLFDSVEEMAKANYPEVFGRNPK